MKQKDFFMDVGGCEHSPIQHQRTGIIRLPSPYLKGEDGGFYKVRQTMMACAKCKVQLEHWDNRKVSYIGENPHENVIGLEAHKAMIEAEEGVSEFWNQ